MARSQDKNYKMQRSFRCVKTRLFTVVWTSDRGESSQTSRSVDLQSRTSLHLHTSGRSLCETEMRHPEVGIKAVFVSENKLKSNENAAAGDGEGGKHKRESNERRSGRVGERGAPDPWHVKTEWHESRRVTRTLISWPVWWPCSWAESRDGWSLASSSLLASESAGKKWTSEKLNTFICIFNHQ